MRDHVIGMDGGSNRPCANRTGWGATETHRRSRFLLFSVRWRQVVRPRWTTEEECGVLVVAVRGLASPALRATPIEVSGGIRGRPADDEAEKKALAM